MIKDKPILLSIAFNYHDSNIALSFGHKIVASLELERLFRCKKIAASVTHMQVAANYLLNCFKLEPSQIDFLIVNALNNLFEESRSVNDVQQKTYKFLGRNIPAFIVRHHLAHAGHYYFSGFNRALIASCDGGGDLGERVTYFKGEGLKIKRLDVKTEAHISTKPYGQFSTYLYDAPFCEGKLMGLSGICDSGQRLAEVEDVFPKLRDVNFTEGQAILLKNFKEYSRLAKTNPHACAPLARSIQKTFMDMRLADLAGVYEKWPFGNIVLAGGSALNLQMNSLIYKLLTTNIYASPNCDDTGIAIGQCAVIIAQILGRRAECSLPFLGLTEDDEEFALTRHFFSSETVVSDDPVAVATLLTQNNLCIRHTNRPEVGPRALGHRSFLLSPLIEKNKEILSSEIKGREPYRPVAPVIIQEDLPLYFTAGPPASPFMLFSYLANKNAKNNIPAIVHQDCTARVQTITRDSDPFLYDVLVEFKKLTGLSILINTSLNLEGQPIANSLHDTYGISRRIHAIPYFLCLM